MGFMVTSLIFAMAGVIASLFVRICCNSGPPANLFLHWLGECREEGYSILHMTLVITATACCWMMWAIVYLAQLKPLIVPILSDGE